MVVTTWPLSLPQQPNRPADPSTTRTLPAAHLHVHEGRADGLQRAPGAHSLEELDARGGECGDAEVCSLWQLAGQRYRRLPVQQGDAEVLGQRIHGCTVGRWSACSSWSCLFSRRRRRPAGQRQGTCAHHPAMPPAPRRPCRPRISQHRPPARRQHYGWKSVAVAVLLNQNHLIQ